ncbi:hypothetical protein GCM10023085_44800 [Actinomadura viridis]|uniref:Uncharacterized protein n=1 Tax=Actinomadura viridis TaxID=58110 RepID=A0A931DI96_9ACTN|nr:hypothetical protein [Actinomadura viridis]MBG6089842.1 hypothetical protein [Actinomadura viridis]
MTAPTSRTRISGLSTRPPAVCPVHPEHELEGGPIRYRCPLGHSLAAADIDHELPPPSATSRLADQIAATTDMNAVKASLHARMRGDHR